MADIELLRRVVSSEDGWYCVVGIDKNDGIKQTHHKTLEEVQTQAEQNVKDERNTFFALGKFKTDASRKAENVGWMQAFFLDIDCGPAQAAPDKHGRIQGYIDQATGLRELKKFCSVVGLPKPILISSGYGIHAYWVLDQTISRLQWEPLAKRLAELCVEQGVIVDPVVFEASRVLRAPGTFNF